MSYIKDIDKEIEYLKTWKKDLNVKFKKKCYDNEAKERINAENRYAKGEIKRLQYEKNSGNTFINTILNSGNPLVGLLINNLDHCQIRYTNNGKPYSNVFIPAVIIYEDKECTIIKDLCLD